VTDRQRVPSRVDDALAEALDVGVREDGALLEGQGVLGEGAFPMLGQHHLMHSAHSLVFREQSKHRKKKRHSTRLMGTREERKIYHLILAGVCAVQPSGAVIASSVAGLGGPCESESMQVWIPTQSRTQRARKSALACEASSITNIGRSPMPPPSHVNSSSACALGVLLQSELRGAPSRWPCP
jgi:hypothetical protein